MFPTPSWRSVKPVVLTESGLADALHMLVARRFVLLAGIERDVMPARLHHPAEPDNLLGKGAGRLGRRGLGMRQRNDVEIHVPPLVTEA